MEWPKEKYEVMYADPPWSYNDDLKHPNNKMSPKHTYTVQLLDWIKILPVPDILADDSVLFMWATYPKLEECLEVVESWGFKYKTVAFVWIKDRPPMCRWAVSRSEIVLLGTKGHPWKYRQCRNVEQLVHAHRTKHSEKPPEVDGKQPTKREPEGLGLV